jgi:hypothetical protein
MLRSPLTASRRLLAPLDSDANRPRRSQRKNLGPNVNISDSESRPSRSRDADTLYFGRAPTGGGPGDVYVTIRSKGRVR